MIAVRAPVVKRIAPASAVFAARALEVGLFNQFLQHSQYLRQVEYIVPAPAVASAPLLVYFNLLVHLDRCS